MIYIIINSYTKSIICYNIKYIKHKKYKKILKINKYIKINDFRNEFKINEKIFKTKQNIIINKYD